MCLFSCDMCIHLCMSKQSFSDLWPLIYYLYLLSALFSFCWATGTELWKQRAVACTNSPGSLARLLNPFHCRLTLMSPARIPQTCRYSRCTQDQHTRTHTNISTSQHHTPLEGMFNDAALLRPSSPLTLLPPVLSPLSFLPPSFLLFFTLLRSQRGRRWPWAWKTRKRTPWGEVRHLQTPTPHHFVTHTWVTVRTHSIKGNSTCLADHQNMIRSCKHTRNHKPFHQRTSKHTYSP